MLTIVSVGEWTSDSIVPKSQGIGGELAAAVAMSAQRRLLHHDKACVFQMPPNPVAAILAVNLSLSYTRFLPLNVRAKAMASAKSSGLAGVSFSAGSGIVRR